MEEAEIHIRRSKAASSLLPALNAGQIQNRTLLRNASSKREGPQPDGGATAATAAVSAGPQHAAAASTSRQAKAPSPKAFRAGFAYERAHTPEHKARQRQLQQQPAAANGQQQQLEGLNHHVQWSAAMPAAGSSNVASTSTTGGTAAAAIPPASPAAAASAANSRAASNTGFGGDGASSSKAAAAQQHSRLGLSSSSPAVGPKNAVIGGSSLLAGHLKGQALHVLQSFVAESLAMLPPESAGGGGEGSGSEWDSDSDGGSSSFGGSRSGQRPGGTTQHPSSSSSSRAGSAAGCQRQRQRLQRCRSNVASSSGGSSRSRAIAAAAVAAGAAAAAAVSAGKRRTGSAARHRAASLPDDQEEEEAALVAMLMMLPSIEPPAVQSAPQQFSLPVVAAALGQSLAELQQEQQRQQQELRQQRQQQRSLSAASQATCGSSQQAQKQPAAAAVAASPVLQQQQQQQRPLIGCNAASTSSKAGVRASPAHRPGTAGLSAATTAAFGNPPTARLPLKTETEGLQLQLRVLSATPALAQQYTKAQVLLAQAFGADVQQQPAPTAATVAAAAATAAATAATRSRPATSRRSSGAKSARKSAAAAGNGAEAKQQQQDPSAAAPAAKETAADAAAAAGSGTARAAKAGRASNRSLAAAVGAATSTQSAAAAAGSGGAGMDPIGALLSGRLSPVRSRVLSASWDQQMRRQQQRLQHGRCGGTSTSSLSASCSSLPGMPGREQGRPFCITPEPFLRSSCGPLSPGSRCYSTASPAVSETRPAAFRSPAAAANSLALATLWAPGSSGSCEAFAASSQPRAANSRYSRSPIAASANTGGNSSPGVLADTSLAAATLSSHAAHRRLFGAGGSAACGSAGDAETSAVFVTQTREEQQHQWGARPGCSAVPALASICSMSAAADSAADGNAEGGGGAPAAETAPGQHVPGSEFLFERHLQLEQGQWKQPTADAVDAEAALSAAAAADVGPCYAWGDTARLIRRFQQQPPDLFPFAFNLNNSFAGQQMAALAQALPHMDGLAALLLRNDGIDDFALQLLVNALLQPGCGEGVVCLDLGYNRLSPDAPRLLAPLLHRPPRVNASAAAASSLRRTASVGQGCDGMPRSPGGCFERSLLLQLVLAGNKIGDAGAEVVCKLVATGDSMLQLLDLSRCGITDRAAGCLRGLLEGARQLQVLRIGWNSLGPKGGRALAEGLAWSSTLQQLLLPWSGISDNGASHIAKALENNSSVKLLDVSGCQVSAATCVVLCETLSVNKELELLVLQDNPLGAAGAHKLLKAVHAGNVKHVDLAGCGFLDACQISQQASQRQQAAPPAAAAAGTAGSAKSKSNRAASAAAGSGKAGAGGRGASGKTGAAAAAAVRAAASPGAVGAAAAAFNAREPGGFYCLDLSSPSDRQVAVELLRLTQEHGLDSWNSPTLDKKAYSIAGVTKQQLPSAGTLCLTFAAKHKASWDTVALTDGEFQSMWSSLVDPRQLARTAAALERELALTSKVLQADAGTRAVQGEAGSEAGGSSSAPSPAAAAAVGRGLGGDGGGSALNTARTAGTAASVAVLATLGVGSWYGAAGAAANSGSAWEATGSGAGGEAGHGCHAHSVTDGWKLQLLRVLCRNCYFTSAQARDVVAAFSYGEDKVEAATQVFGRVVDPQNFSQVYSIMAPWQVELADSRIGCLKLFSPDNPTGKYSLLLSHPAQRLVAARLVELFCQQHIEGLCAFPHSVCFTSAALDEAGLPPEQLADPTTITLPKTGLFKVCFVDLRPVPASAVPLSAEGFAVLIGVLVAASHLDARALSEAVDDVDVKTKVTVVGRFNTWQATHGPFSGKVSALRRLAPEPGAVRVKDLVRFVEAIHLFAIHHCLEGPQLVELVRLLPESASEERVELCSCFWARLVDRSKAWTDVVRCLTHEQQVSLCQRLGYANVYDPVRPAMHYRLRMWRPDDHQIAWRLHRTALNAQHECFANFSIDGVLKKISQTPNLWSVMRGSAADNEKPTVTLEFDFVWEDSLQPHWAAVTIQAAWRAFLSRKHNPDAAAAALLTARLRASRPGTAAVRPATGVRANNSSRLGQRQPGNLAAAAAGSGTAAMVLRVQTPDGSSSSSRASGWPGAARSPGAASPTSRLAQPQWDSLLFGRAAGAVSTAAGSSGHQQQQQRLQSAGSSAVVQRRPDSAASGGTFLSLGMSSVEQAL